MSYEELDRVSVIERVVAKRLTQSEAARMLGLTTPEGLGLGARRRARSATSSELPPARRGPDSSSLLGG